MGGIMESVIDNSTNATELDYLPYSARLETYLVPILFSIIFVGGILGNWTVCVIFIKHSAMRNVPNTYIFSLAFGDLLVILICVPLAGLVYVTAEWPWDGDLGDWLCRGSEFAKDISIGVSIFTLVALASDRYTGIVNPLKKLQARSKMVLVIIIITWSLAVLFALPAVIVSEVITTNDIKYCSPFGSYGKTYKKYATIIKATIYYFLPLTIIAILYTLMSQKLQRSATEVQNIASCPLKNKNPQAQNRRHVARMVIVFILVFIICFLPHWIFQLWFWLSEDAEDNYNTTWHYVRIIGFCLYFLNSTLNPLALYFVSSLFRQHFHTYLCCRRSTLEHGVSFTRGHSTYKKPDNRVQSTFIDTSNYSLS